MRPEHFIFWHVYYCLILQKTQNTSPQPSSELEKYFSSLELDLSFMVSSIGMNSEMAETVKEMARRDGTEEQM